jgi:3-phytase
MLARCRSVALPLMAAALVAACGAPGPSLAPTSAGSVGPSASAAASVEPGPSTSASDGPSSGESDAPPTASSPAWPDERFAVTATVETEPVPHDGDAADDPAIWIDPDDPSRSLVIGTDKRPGGGLLVYDLAGRQVAAALDGATNNVDVRGDIVVAGNERTNSIAVYRVDPAGQTLEPLSIGEITPGITIYGTCLFQSATDGSLYAIVTDEEGAIEQWQLEEATDGWKGTLRRTLSVGSQSEGCVADDERGVLYVAEEEVGIWRWDAEPDGSAEGTLLDTTDGGNLAADVEGLAIAADAAGGGLLIASSQGDNAYVVYDRIDNRYLATFEIADGEIDGTRDTDGIDVTTVPLGSGFSLGLLVAQDGRNDDGNQNFKLVPLDRVLAGGASTDP